MRRLVVPLIALGALALPAAAPAKDVRSATVCGPDACATTRDRPALRTLLEGNAPAAPPAAAARFYTVRYRMGPDGSYTVRWLPGQGLVRSADPDPDSPTWVRPDPQGLVLLRKVADGLRPFPARELGPLRASAGAGALPPEVVAPAAAERGGGGGDGGGLPAGALLGTGAALLAALLLVLLGRRRRRQRGIAAGLTVLAVAALLPIAAASAKELSAAELCDAQRCISVRDRPTVESLADSSMLTGPPAVAGKPYRLRFHVTHEGDEVASWSATWYPEAGVVQMTGETGAPRYYEPMFPARTALDRLTARLHGDAPSPGGDTGGGGVPWPAWAALAALLVVAAGAAVRRSRAVPRGRRAAAPRDEEGPSLAS